MKKIVLVALTLIVSWGAMAQNSYAKNGIFVDALMGGSAFSKHKTDGEVGYFSLDARVGSKWYLGSESKFRSGVQLIYGRIGFNASKWGALFNFLPVNAGYTSYWSISDAMGLELNLNVGPGMAINKYTTLMGIHVNPEFKLRYKALALGFDFSFLNGGNLNTSTSYTDKIYWYSLNTYSVVFGLKF